MEKLKALFGSDALTFEQLEEKLKDNKEIKLANLASGNYVDKAKHEAKAKNPQMLKKMQQGDDYASFVRLY